MSDQFTIFYPLNFVLKEEIMKLKIKKMLAILTVMLLAACGDDSNVPNNSNAAMPINSPTDALTQLVLSGSYPDLDTSDTLAGSVTNEEAIRDDILAFIEKANLTVEQKTQVKDVARSIQEAVLLDHSDIDAVLKTDEQSTIAIGCLSLAFENPADSHQILKAMEHYTANTRDRAAAYSAYNEALDGTVTRLPSTLDCGE